MLIIFTGNGKGKTTAALGQAARMVGRGKRVLMIQFIKGPWKSGEDFVSFLRKDADSRGLQSRTNADEQPADIRGSVHSKKNEGRFEIRKRGLGFVGILGDKLPREDHAKAAMEAFQEFETELKSGKWHLIILDEINNALALGLLSKDAVLAAVAEIPKEQFIIFTGRDAPKEFIERADLVTEMREIKHPFNDGEMAKIAVEF